LILLDLLDIPEALFAPTSILAISMEILCQAYLSLFAFFSIC
jgi:hypothetical protein